MNFDERKTLLDSDCRSARESGARNPTQQFPDERPHLKRRSTANYARHTEMVVLPIKNVEELPQRVRHNLPGTYDGPCYCRSSATAGSGRGYTYATDPIVHDVATLQSQRSMCTCGPTTGHMRLGMTPCAIQTARGSGRTAIKQVSVHWVASWSPCL